MSCIAKFSVAAADKAKSDHLDWGGMGQSALKVLVIGLVFGAGLPACYALGMRLWDRGTDTVHEDGTVSRGNPVLLAGAALAFLIVAAAVVCGLLLIMSKTINHYTGVQITFPGMS